MVDMAASRARLRYLGQLAVLRLCIERMLAAEAVQETFSLAKVAAGLDQNLGSRTITIPCKRMLQVFLKDGLLELSSNKRFRVARPEVLRFLLLNTKAATIALSRFVDGLDDDGSDLGSTAAAVPVEGNDLGSTAAAMPVEDDEWVLDFLKMMANDL